MAQLSLSLSHTHSILNNQSNCTLHLPSSLLSFSRCCTTRRSAALLGFGSSGLVIVVSVDVLDVSRRSRSLSLASSDERPAAQLDAVQYITSRLSAPRRDRQANARLCKQLSIARCSRCTVLYAYTYSIRIRVRVLDARTQSILYALVLLIEMYEI